LKNIKHWENQRKQLKSTRRMITNQQPREAVKKTTK
jgi:hypothetical protein